MAARTRDRVHLPSLGAVPVQRGELELFSGDDAGWNLSRMPTTYCPSRAKSNCNASRNLGPLAQGQSIRGKRGTSVLAPTADIKHRYRCIRKRRESGAIRRNGSDLGHIATFLVFVAPRRGRVARCSRSQPTMPRMPSHRQCPTASMTPSKAIWRHAGPCQRELPYEANLGAAHGT